MGRLGCGRVQPMAPTRQRDRRTLGRMSGDSADDDEAEWSAWKELVKGIEVQDDGAGRIRYRLHMGDGPREFIVPIGTHADVLKGGPVEALDGGDGAPNYGASETVEKRMWRRARVLLAGFMKNMIETTINLDGDTTWLVHIGGQLVYADHVDGQDHARAFAAAKAYTDKNYRGVEFWHHRSKQLA